MFDKDSWVFILSSLGGLWVVIVGGIVYFCRDIISKCLWSLAIYFTRGEFNHDNNETTPDKFLWYNEYTGNYKECYILRYSIGYIGWGFFLKDKFVYKKSNWLSWLSFSNNRFPMPLNVDKTEPESILKVLQRR